MKSAEDLQREITSLNLEMVAADQALNAAVPQLRRDFVQSFKHWSEALVQKYIVDNAVIVCRGSGASLGLLRTALDQAYLNIAQRYKFLLAEESHLWPHVTKNYHSIEQINEAVDAWFAAVFKEMTHHLGEALTQNNWLFDKNVLPAPWRKEGNYNFPGHYDNAVKIVNGFAEIRRYKRELQYRTSLQSSVERKEEDRRIKLATGYWRKACEGTSPSAS